MQQRRPEIVGFGLTRGCLRCVISYFCMQKVLVAAGQLKRKEPGSNEDLLLIRAMRDSNVPKVRDCCGLPGVRYHTNHILKQPTILTRQFHTNVNVFSSDLPQLHNIHRMIVH